MNRVVSIIYVSRSGNTERMVLAAAEGAKAAGAQVNVKEAAEATGADLEQGDALIWGTGNYYGYMHGQLKDWFDREHRRLNRKNKAGEMKPRPYFCCLSAAANPYRQLPVIERLSAGMNLKKAYEPVTSKGKPTEEVLAQCYERGRDLVGIDAGEMIDLYVPVPLAVPPKKIEITPPPVILMVAPATGDDTAKAKELAKNRFPDHEVRLISSQELGQTYHELLACGKTNLVVAPLVLTDDAWCQDVVTTPAVGLNVEYAWPLLAAPESLAQVGKVLLADHPEGVITIVCPAGSDAATPSLLRLDAYLRRRGSRAWFGPDPRHIADELRVSQVTHVRLRPLAMTPASQATRTVMREIAKALKRAGIECRVESGSDYFARIMAIWLDEVARALKALGEDVLKE